MGYFVFVLFGVFFGGVGRVASESCDLRLLGGLFLSLKCVTLPRSRVSSKSSTRLFCTRVMLSVLPK